MNAGDRRRWPRIRGCRRAALAVAMLLSGGLLAAQSAEDERAIRAILDDRQAAWSFRDAAAWVRDFTADSGFVNILGMRFADRAGNEERHAALFATIFRDSLLTVELLHIRFADSDSAVVEARLQLTGYERLPPGIRETEPGMLATRLLDVVQRIDGRWRVVFSQNTAIAPLPSGPAD